MSILPSIPIAMNRKKGGDCIEQFRKERIF